MIMKIIFTKTFQLGYILSLGIACSTSYLCALDLKKFDAPPQEREKYLAFRSPPPLRYTPIPLAADRLSLISPDATGKVVEKKEPVDTNASQEPDFPIVTYSTESEIEKKSFPGVIPQIAPPTTLPLADPFEGVVGTDVGTTDELLNVFDDLRVNSGNIRMNPIPFIPPYTVAPDNLKIGTKATYRRVPR